MNKQEWRKYFTEQRSSLSTESIQEKSKSIADLFFKNISLEKIKTLHVFLPIVAKKEIDTSYIIQKIAKEYPHIQIVVPIADFSKNEIASSLYDKNTPLQNNQWGIPEPVHPVFINDQNIDLILLPLLGADLHGNRLGYGKGFYDKFLSKCKKEVIKVGLCLEAPVELLPADDWDKPLSQLIYPDGFVSFV